MKKRDINFRIDKYIVNLRAVAIIVNEKKVLFQKKRTSLSLVLFNFNIFFIFLDFFLWNCNI